MQEKEFKKLLVDTIRYGNNPNKDQMIELLKIIQIRFEKTGTFTGHLWNHYQEYLYLIIVPQKIEDLKRHLDEISKICYQIYEPNDEYELWNVSIKPGNLPVEEDISQDILFKDIQKQIVEEIKSAKYMILIAVAWFTDPVLYNELIKKKSDGLNIQIVIDNNDTNNNAQFRLEDSFETYKVSIFSLYKNLISFEYAPVRSDDSFSPTQILLLSG